MEKQIIYQVYPLSFKDTNDDGKGDLKGIISKLPYLKSLGINYLWLSPIYKSPFKDNGYDVADYYEIDQIFGTKQDLITLISQAYKYNIKIMLDMVFNHTSTHHPWFRKWLQNDPQFKDFYISRKSINKPPTNWISKFGKPAWKEYKPNHWYLHLFDETQADLNWENPKVRQKLQDVLKHYVNIGVKGFRFDVINLISKGHYINDEEGDGRKFYTDGPKAHQYIQELLQVIPQTKNFLTIAELSSTNLANACWYSSQQTQTFSGVFIFHHLKIDYLDNQNKFKETQFDVSKFYDVLKYWSENMYKNSSVMINFLNNHDQPRSVSRFIDKKFRETGAKMLFALTSSLPGIPCLFQGEEIGMENADFKTIADFHDVETINYLQKHNFTDIPKAVLNKSRDLSRTPMQWNNNQYAGFSNVKPWIKINNNYQKINVKKDRANSNSIWQFYKSYILLLKENKVFTKGDIKFDVFQSNVITYTRKYQNYKYKFIFSFNNKKVKYQFNNKSIVMSNYKSNLTNELLPYQFIMERVK